VIDLALIRSQKKGQKMALYIEKEEI
jgi:hypothetical protein